MSDPHPPPGSASGPDDRGPTDVGPTRDTPTAHPRDASSTPHPVQAAPSPHLGPPSRSTHPRAVPAMVLGLVGLSGLFCLVPFALSPVAWYYGAVARREAERDERTWAPSPFATAGIVTGAVGTVLLVFGTAAVVAVALVTWLVTGSSTGYEP